MPRVEAFDVETITNMAVGPKPYGGRDRIFAYCTCDMAGQCKVRRIDPARVDGQLQRWLDDATVENV
jgi:hypothetical protein